MRESAGPAPLTAYQTSSSVLRDLERAENFPVALRILPREVRSRLATVYDVARVIDDLGDRAQSDREELLLQFRRDLAEVWGTGRPVSPVLQRLVPVVRELGLSPEPFDRLVQANLQDQRVATYDSFEDLLGYCSLSADPIGRLVLAVFGAATPRTEELSDRVCTALQLLEHWQDVAEDRANGRVYLPQQTLREHGVEEHDLDAAATSPRLRQALRAETARAEQLLGSGTELLGLLRGWARVAVAGYVGGGQATVRALRRADFDVLAGPPRPRRRDTALRGALLLSGVSR
ncbi:MAG: hypothetical protein QOJ11_3155 [Frankiales bacterium]|jgi:squalene synthase HpnC|nr:hypothetical protein [Frankiales bacterium]